MDFNPYFEQYEQLVRQVDTAFEKVKTEYGDAVRCTLGCADCCHALFDLTLVEALYVKSRLDGRLAGKDTVALMERANEADRKIYRIKRQAHKDHEAGKPEHAILEEMALQRVRCPCLDADDRCVIYDVRPITCRVYGIPTVIGGKAHTCGVSGFKEGQTYPTVRLDQIYQRLYDISHALAQNLQSRYPKLAEMLVPLSMALLTDYNEEYLGVSAPAQVKTQE